MTENKATEYQKALDTLRDIVDTFCKSPHSKSIVQQAMTPPWARVEPPSPTKQELVKLMKCLDDACNCIEVIASQNPYADILVTASNTIPTFFWNLGINGTGKKIEASRLKGISKWEKSTNPLLG